MIAQRLVLGSEDRRPDVGCHHVLAVQRDLQPVEAAEVDPAVPDWIALLLERGEPLHERADRDLPFDARKGGTEGNDITLTAKVSDKATLTVSTSGTTLQGGQDATVVAAGTIILFVVVIAIGALIYFSAKSGDAAVNKTIIANTTPTPDVEKQRLQDELANVQKKLDEQQMNANRPANVPTFPSPNRPGVVTARVNSPKDGFLALRNQPDADYGERIAKIPHGSMITIENCDRSAVSIGGRSGRWCLVSWNGYEGYVFDAWLVY